MSPSSRRDAWIVGVVATLARVAVAVWAWGRFPPVDDAIYYEKIASRIAAGEGSTWLWPDGVVTYAAHYPVGYPFLVSLAYRAFGATPSTAMLVNGALGVLASLAALGLLRRWVPPRVALVGAILVSVEPALLAYLPALMTEAVTAHLLVVAAYFVVRASESRRPSFVLAAGAVLGLATLVRPQCVLLAPWFGLIGAPEGAIAKGKSAAVALAVALAVCAPWTARNCVRMKRCALVSVNGGWNLLIGAAEGATGRWAPIPVPEGCKLVFDEAAKDACFGDAARREIASHPGRFLSLVPAKLSQTFDYAGAAPYHLHASNAEAFGERAKVVLGGIESVFHRGALVAALVAIAWRARRFRKVGWALVAVGGASTLAVLATQREVGAWVGHLALAVACLVTTRAALPALAAATILGTAAVHAVFFGAGRYGLPTFPFVTMLACAVTSAAWRKSPADSARDGADP